MLLLALCAAVFLKCVVVVPFNEVLWLSVAVSNREFTVFSCVKHRGLIVVDLSF